MSKCVAWGLCLVFVGLCSALYPIKIGAERKVQEIKRIDRLLVQERETLQVLQAEWSFLNQPEYLQSLSQKHLRLMPASADRTAFAVDTPFFSTPGLEKPGVIDVDHEENEMELGVTLVSNERAE